MSNYVNHSPSCSLVNFHTFALPVYANEIKAAHSVTELVQIYQSLMQKNENTLILGQGSNTLFIDNFAGTIILNRLKGIRIEETDEHWLLHIGAGEVWHDFVHYTLENKMPGLENLALIPGCIGSAVIQNIGAYGVEQQKYCQYVDVLNLKQQHIERIYASQCAFGYRESVFKQPLYQYSIVIAAGYALPKSWQPTLTYGELTLLDKNHVTPMQIFDKVCEIRQQKLPDPKQYGNAGSFFKNPIVSQSIANKLREQYPSMPSYVQQDGSVKLAAGWLIDKCGLRGYRIGNAAVHEQQALVIINLGNATTLDIIQLAAHIIHTVDNHFHITLEPEVRFIGNHGEINAVEFLKQHMTSL